MSSALASTSHSAPPRAARVMIVDDSVVVRGLTSRWLEEAGFVVERAESRRETFLTVARRVD